MQTITKFLVLLALSFSMLQLNAQDTSEKSEVDKKIELLQELKEKVKANEKEVLKQEIEAINKRFDKGEISKEELETYTKDVEKLIDDMSKWQLLIKAVRATKQIFANIK